MKPFIRKNKNTILQQRCWESEPWKKEISKNSQHLFDQKIATQKRKKHEKQQLKPCSGQTFCQKETVQQKGNHHFLCLALRRKNYGFQRKMSSKKKELILFSGQTLCKKKYGIQETVWVPKKRNSYFFRAKHCAKKSVRDPKKSMSSQEKGTHTFFRPNIV